MNRYLALSLGVLLLGPACSSKPDPAQEHREKGDALFHKNEFKKAAEEWKLSLDADPKQTKLWENMAYALQQAGDSDGADAAYMHTLEGKTPAQLADAYRSLAATYVERGDLIRGEKYYQKAVEIQPNDEVSLGWIAEIYAQRGGSRAKTPGDKALLEKAMTYYDKVIALKPDAPFTYINKRITVAKLFDTVKNEGDKALEDAKREKDKAKAKELRDLAEKDKAQTVTLKAEYDHLTEKFTELQKAAKAKADGGAK